MSEFTPGPWRWVGDPRERIDAPDGHAVLWPRNIRQIPEPETWHDLIGDYDRPEVEVEANARLIEAAPEMFALLRRCKCGCSPGDGGWCDDRDALLARIDGKDPAP